MRLILFICLSASCFCYGQFPAEVYAFEKELMNDYTFPKVYRQELRQAKNRFIRIMYNDTVNGICGGKLTHESLTEFRKAYDSCIFVHDFDYDGDYDILFHGGTCYENPDVSIYYKNKKKYERQVLGNRVVSLERHADSCSLTVLKTPCCIDFRFQIIHLVSKKKGHSGFQQTTNESFYYDYSHKNAAKYDLIDTSFTLSSEKTLWMAPNLSQEQIDNFTSGGEILGAIKENTVVHASNSYLANGKTWYYVHVKTGTEFTPTGFWNVPYYGVITSFRGWICLEE